MSAVAAMIGRKTGALSVNINDATCSASGVGGAGAGYNLVNDGTGNGSGIAGFTWLQAGAASNYEVRATLQSGTFGSGTYNVWLNLGTSRNWSLTESSIGTLTNTNLLQIRSAASGVILDSAIITLSATRTS
jgi:hypothetical protein